MDSILDKDIIEIIKKEDSNFIKEQEIKNNCVYKFKVIRKYIQEENNNLTWCFPNDTYCEIIGIPSNEYFDEDDSRHPLYELNYLYGYTNKSIINIPHQGGMDAYQIENNKISAIYKDIHSTNNSFVWRSK